MAQNHSKKTTGGKQKCRNQVEENQEDHLVKNLLCLVRKVGVGSKEVYDWIRETIGKTNKKVGKAICPFAKASVEAKAIQVVPGKSDLVDQINHCCNLFSSLALDCVVIYVQYKITEQELAKVCGKGQKKNPSYAVMYDHPDNDGLHQGVSFSFGKCPLIFIQELSKLKDAQSRLRRTSYYQSWGIDPDDDMFY